MDPATSSNDVISSLTAVKGIGPWSAAMFLMFHKQAADVLPLGDLVKLEYEHSISALKLFCSGVLLCVLLPGFLVALLRSISC